MPNVPPSNEQIEAAARTLDTLYAKLPPNTDKQRARHWLELSQQHAEQSREAGPEPLPED